MAQKRMFDKSIIDTDRFCDMPMSTKALYFVLGMEADDFGFVSPRRVMRMHGGTDDDLKILISKQFLIYFPSGVVVITDWCKNNWLDKRRIAETEFKEELKSLELFENKYILRSAKHSLSNGLESIEENSIEENSIEENSIEENSIEESSAEEREVSCETLKTKSKKFTKPSLEEINNFILENNLKVNGEHFYDYYESNGWKVGKNSMKDWKATLRNWNRNNFKNTNTKEYQSSTTQAIETIINGEYEIPSDILPTFKEEEFYE